MCENASGTPPLEARCQVFWGIHFCATYAVDLEWLHGFCRGTEFEKIYLENFCRMFESSTDPVLRDLATSGVHRKVANLLFDLFGGSPEFARISS